MSALDLLGDLFGVGLPGPEPDALLREQVRDLRPGVFVLFSRNLRSEAQARELVAGLREISPAKVLLAVDQEGGRVDRLTSLLPGAGLPSAHALSGLGGESVRRFGEATGRTLVALGLDWDLAPVLDLDRPGRANGIGDRSFGTDPGTVSEMAGAFLEGLGGAGVLGCLKHFPGLGPTDLDTHQALAVCPKDASRLWAEDAEPYRRLCPSADAVMVGHAAYPAVSGRADLPAGQSRELVDGWLRERIGFRGLVVTDDLEMGAVSARSDGENARAALEAGCDLLLFCSDPDRARRARDELARPPFRSGHWDERVEEASSRLRALVGKREAAPTPAASFSQAAAELAGLSR